LSYFFQPATSTAAAANNMTDSCNTCGKTSSLMNCKRCKSVAYCSADCQRLDWKTHKPSCQRKEFAGAACDRCGRTEDSGLVLCVNCGSIGCIACHEQDIIRGRSGEVVSLKPCFRCNSARNYARAGDRKKLEKLIKESPRDPRLANWLTDLGELFTLLMTAGREKKRR
jgi:MYND finger